MNKSALYVEGVVEALFFIEKTIWILRGTHATRAKTGSSNRRATRVSGVVNNAFCKQLIWDFFTNVFLFIMNVTSAVRASICPNKQATLSCDIAYRWRLVLPQLALELLEVQSVVRVLPDRYEDSVQIEWFQDLGCTVTLHQLVRAEVRILEPLEFQTSGSWRGNGKIPAGV